MSYIPASDFALEVGKGNVAGVTTEHKFGRNPNIGTATDPEDVWDAGGLWIPPTEARVHDIASSSANDAGSVVSNGTATGGSRTTLVDSGANFIGDGVAVKDAVINDTTLEHSTVISVTATTLTCHDSAHGGNVADSGDLYRVVNSTSTGAAIVHIYGLDSNMDLAEEFIVMNGTTNVNTIRTYWRIFRIHTDAVVDRNVNNVGDIAATAQTDNTITAQINAGNGQTLMAIYTVPRGKTVFMTSFFSGINSGSGLGTLADITLRTTSMADLNGAGSKIELFGGVGSDGTSHSQHKFHPYKMIEEQTDVCCRVESVSSNNTDIIAGFDFFLVDNT